MKGHPDVIHLQTLLNNELAASDRIAALRMYQDWGLEALYVHGARVTRGA